MGPHGWGAIHVVLHSWPAWNSGTLGDVAVNVLAYLPVGLFGYLVLASMARPAVAMTMPVLGGFLLSFAIEVTQNFIPTRAPSISDVAANTAGAAIGVVAGLLWQRMTVTYAERPDSMLLIGAWIAAQAFPFVPQFIHPLVVPFWRPVDSFEDFAAALAVALLVGSLAASALTKRILLTTLLLLVPLRAYILSRTVTEGSIAAVAVALAVALFVRVRPGPVAAVLACAIALHGFSPFHFTAAPYAFTWIPFRAALQINAEVGLVIIMYKVFLYGSLLWLIHESGRSIAASTALTCALLAGIEAAQRWIPTHTPEITDPLIALILSWVSWSLMRGVRMSMRDETAPTPAGAIN